MVDKVLVYGNGEFARLIANYLLNDEKIRFRWIYCTKREFISNNLFFGKKVFPYEDLESYFDFKPNIILAIGYSVLNSVRKRIFEILEKDGYKIMSYILRTVIIDLTASIGDANVFLENVVIQPFVKIGKSNVFFLV